MNRLAKLFEGQEPRTEMSEDETRIAFAIMSSEDPAFNTAIEDLDKESELYKHFQPLIDGFQLQVFLSRLKHISKMRITLGAFIMIAQHLESAGVAVMYAYYIWLKLKPHTLITTTVLAEELFPWGYFSEEQLNTIWDAQKINGDEKKHNMTPIMFDDSDNLIDFQQSWIK